MKKDTKALLLENMIKLNPDFKLTEGDDKWIQKAVDPEHKGYCTPMTKPTCTPARKALAKRFKKGIDEMTERGQEVIYKFKTDAITETMGSRDGKQYRHPVYLIEGNPKYAPTYDGVVLSISDTPGAWYVDTLMEGNARNSNIMYIDFGAKWICSNWSEIMRELGEVKWENIWISGNKEVQKEGVDLNTLYGHENYEEKVDKIKKILDTLLADQKGTTLINVLFRLIVGGNAPTSSAQKIDVIKQTLDNMASDPEEREDINPVYTVVTGSQKGLQKNMSEDYSTNHKKKVDLIKGKLDFLFDNNHYDLIDKLDKIINQLYSVDEPETELAEAIKIMKSLIL